MVPALIALITLLFFGGNSTDYFLVAELEKGVKNFVIEKETKKEIQSTFKIQEKKLKEIDKERGKLIKELSKINSDRNSTLESFKGLEKKLSSNLSQRQDIVIYTRVHTLEKLSTEEWQQIAQHSKDATAKKKDKLQKKLDKKKEKDALADLEKSIKNSIEDAEKREKVLASLENLRKSYNILANKLKEKNILDTPALEDKATSTEDLKEMANFLRQLRMEALNEMVEFRFNLIEQTNEKEWSKIMKSLNKVLKQV